ncbi:MAG: KamA family radical SAM protein [Planctomycetota bacterium]
MKTNTQKGNGQGGRRIKYRKRGKVALRLNDHTGCGKAGYISNIGDIAGLKESKIDQLNAVTEKFPFRSNEYYLSLINWDDPDDPIRRIIIPDVEELHGWGRLDPSDEKAYVIMPGLEHKYNSTVLLLVSNICDGICRYCFRKRVFLEPQNEYLRDIPAALKYIRGHTEITNALLTGGDPLMLPSEKLADIVGQLRQIEHVQIIRIGTRMPVFNPCRIIEDHELLKMINKYSTDEKKIYIVTHFDHPREITDIAIKGVSLMQKAGAVVVNQTPLIRGVNSNPEVLAELFAKLSYVGIAPYYVFQCRPALGNRAYTVPIEEGYEIFEAAKSKVSGLGKRAKFVMSHSTGKIEIVGKTAGLIYFKYHRAADDADSGRFLIFKNNPKAYWLDDYNEVIADYPVDMPYRTYGPE